MFGILIVQILFAVSFIIFKKTLLYGQPFFLVAIRMLLAGTLIFGYHLLFEKRVKITSQLLTLILTASIFNIYITNAFELWGLRFITAAKANFIYNLAPFMAAFFSYFMLGEKMSLKKWIGLMIGFIGFIPILIIQSPGEVFAEHIGWLSSGELALICAAIGTSLGWVSVKKLGSSSLSIAFVNGSTMFLGGLFALVNSMFVETWRPLPINNYGYAILYTLLGTFSLCILAYNLYVILLRRYSATFLALSGLICPLITALLGWIFLDETVGIGFFISFVIVFIWLYIFYSQESKTKILNKNS
jgi:drug/metabolite transporter (DMT)-like permease